MTDKHQTQEHPQAGLLRAIAEGKTIQGSQHDGKYWIDMNYDEVFTMMIASRHLTTKTMFRVKPTPKADILGFMTVGNIASLATLMISQTSNVYKSNAEGASHNLMVTFDGETGALKAAEVIS